MTLFLKLLAVLYVTQVTHAYIQCNGGFDIFMLMDHSSSTGDNYQKHMLPFAAALSKNYISDYVRLSLIVFESTAQTIVPLTHDYNQVAYGINSLISSYDNPFIGRGTNIGAGLEQIKVDPSVNVNRLVFIVSDGCDLEPYKANTRQRAQALKQAGVNIYVIYVPSSNEKEQCPLYLQSLASTPVTDHFFPILTPPYFDNLNRPDFIDNIVTSSCLQITGITPSQACNSTKRNIRVFGQGFAVTDDLDKFYCKFSTQDNCVDNVGWRDKDGSERR